MKLILKCLIQSLLHPLTPIQLTNPGKTMSPAPWWGSIIVLIIGIASWCISAILGINGLDEAGRAMVYLPLGNLFGMSMKIYSGS